MMCLHVEFALFLWMLVGVAATIRSLVADQALRGAWVSFFLFPIIFVYDNNMGGAADHVCAFFAPVISLAAVRMWAQFSLGASVLLAIGCGGALLTKYQASYFFPPIALLVVARAVKLALAWRSFRAGRRERPSLPSIEALRQPAIILGVGALVVLPHFLKNVIFYGNPIYPFAQTIFQSTRPTVDNGAYYVDHILKDYYCQPHGPRLERLWTAAKLFFTFSFEPRYSFTKNVPVFGSLFTLLLPIVPFLRERSRIGIVALIGSGALLAWCLTFNVDRNLQVFMPVLAGATGATIVSLWRGGWLTRLGLLPPLVLQLAWGADALFYDGGDRIGGALALIRSGFDGGAASRYEGYRLVERQIGSSLPKDAVVVLHSSHRSLGIDRRILLDWTGYQGLISYAGMHGPRELFDYFRSLGVTHLFDDPHVRPASSKQEEIVWNALTAGYAREVGRFGNYALYALPDVPPPVERPYRAATLELSGYGSGIYQIEHLGTQEYLPGHLKQYRSPDESLPSIAEQEAVSKIVATDAILVGAGAVLDEQLSGAISGRFGIALKMPNQYTLYLRRERLQREE